ncbi:hypothetical protein ACV9XY_000195 [Citrobacter freundii]
MEITSYKDVWLVVGNTDLTEGRGFSVILHVCDSKETAERLGKKKYVQGSDCPVEKSKAFLINKRWHVPGEIIPESDNDCRLRMAREKRESVISKMREQGFSEEEIQALI